MKKATLLAMGISAFIAFTTNQTQAQEAKDKKPAQEGSGGHSHFTKIPATVEEIWTAIHKQQGKLVNVVAQKDLGEAHDHAFAIRDLVKALPEKVPAENKTKAEAGAKKIAKIAADIDKAGAAQAQKATEANVKKMSEAIIALQSKLQPTQIKK
ncbi:MAG: hypothetical protein ABIP71_03855 [Verrucomicrobiota bacterium]